MDIHNEKLTHPLKNLDILSIGIVLFLILSFTGKTVCHAATYTVDASAGGNFTTINAAVDAASNGDSIIVRNGTYNESVSVDKSVVIQSEYGYETTFVATSSGPGFDITVDNATIDGFTVYNTSPNSGTAIFIAGGYGSCNIINNRCGYDAEHNSDYGIYLDDESTNNVVNGNIFNFISGAAIYLRDSNYNTISDNTTYDGYWGICLVVNSDYNIIFGNTSSNNYVGFNVEVTSSFNTIYLNNFSDNTYNITSTENSINSWWSPAEVNYSYNGTLYNSYLGNYYDDHDHTDTDGDGITDNPYAFPDAPTGIEPDDEYPLAGTPGNFLTDLIDRDDDTITDINDNCLNNQNTNQADGDNDGIGDICDNCIAIDNVDQVDTDHDGTGDLCDDCPSDPDKIISGKCGCGTPESACRSPESTYVNPESLPVGDENDGGGSSCFILTI